MDRKHVRLALFSGFLILSIVLALSLLSLSSPTFAAPPAIGHVYVATNTVPNAIVTFDRFANGSLKFVSTTPIGGSGNGITRSTEGSVQFSPDRRWLFVADSQSNQIAVVAVKPSGLLVPTTLVSSGGLEPVSLTAVGNLLYVVNDGNFQQPANVVGFTVGANGSLTPIPGAVRVLNPTPPRPFVRVGEVRASPDGKILMVTEAFPGSLVSFRILPGGALSSGTSFTPAARFPKVFAFRPPHPQEFVLSGVASVPPNSATGVLTSYRVTATGPALLSGPLADQHTYPSRVEVTGDGRFAYMLESTGFVSAYEISATGVLTLLSSTSVGTAAIPFTEEMALAPADHFLYISDFDNSGTSLISFRILPNGKLVKASRLLTTALVSGAAGMVVN